MTELPATQPSLPPQEQEKLRELTSQSWNLELVISGAALVAILQLPDLLDQAFDYFRFNLMSQTAGFQGIIPSLAYSMMKATAYVLFVAFLINFVMRAFWVGLVGLLAVYPSGIHYDRLPFTTPYAQERMANELGPLDRYILRLDRRCNIVFGLAFLLVFLLMFVAFSYLLVLFGYSILQPVVPPEAWKVIKIAAYGLMALYFIASIVLSLPRVRAHPTGMKLHYQFSSFSKLMYWGMYKPFGFIINTFYSHLPYQKIIRTIALLLGVFFVLVLVEFMADFSRVDRRVSLFNRRHLYTARVDSLYINPSAYDNQRADDAYVNAASIQADVIREPFVRLYVAYPKALDTLLTRLAGQPRFSDTLPRTERYRLFAEWSSQQISRLICIQVNDSVYRNVDLLFTQRGKQQQRGWQAVLIPTNLKTGKNTIQIGIQKDSLHPGEKIATIPFWYVPDK